MKSIVVFGAAVIFMGLCGCTKGNSSLSSDRSVSATATPVQSAGPNQHVVGEVPPNWRPHTGTIITGAAADKAKAAALASYPGGIVNRVLLLDDGSYAVHMIEIAWPHHVFMTKNFKVTGAIG